MRHTARILRLRLLHHETGSAAVEAAVILPLAIMLFFGFVHLAIYLYGLQLTSAIAEVSYNEARLYKAGSHNGTDAGYQHARDIAGDTLTNVTISVNRTETTVIAHVSGTTSSIIPGLPIHVESTVSGPVERWIP